MTICDTRTLWLPLKSCHGNPFVVCIKTYDSKQLPAMQSVILLLLMFSGIFCEQLCVSIDDGVYDLRTTTNFSNPLMEGKGQLNARDGVMDMQMTLVVNLLWKVDDLDYYEFSIQDAKLTTIETVDLPYFQDKFYASVSCERLVNFYTPI
jgi:hypothetical protein